MIYYTRTLKTGERYTTGYKDAATAKRIANQETTSSEKSLWDGELFYNMQTGEYGKDATGAGLVSHIRGGSDTGQGGRFAVFSIVDGQPNDLGIRFAQYGDANKFVRAIVGAYGELFVIEVDKQGSKLEQHDDDSISMSEKAPF